MCIHNDSKYGRSKVKPVFLGHFMPLLIVDSGNMES